MVKGLGGLPPTQDFSISGFLGIWPFQACSIFIWRADDWGFCLPLKEKNKPIDRNANEMFINAAATIPGKQTNRRKQKSKMSAMEQFWQTLLMSTPFVLKKVLFEIHNQAGLQATCNRKSSSVLRSFKQSCLGIISSRPTFNFEQEGQS